MNHSYLCLVTRKPILEKHTKSRKEKAILNLYQWYPAAENFKHFIVQDILLI
jgi:hypothetical protein